MYKKGKKLDSKGIILACVGIIIVCIAINVAFALFPPTGRTDDNSAVESPAASDGAVDTDGFGTDDESEGAADGQGDTIQVDPSIVAVPDNLPEEMTSEYGAPEKTLIESSGVNTGMGPDGSDIPYWIIRAYFPNETEIPLTFDYTKGEGFNVGTY